MCKKHYDAVWAPGYRKSRRAYRAAYEKRYREQRKEKIAAYRLAHKEDRRSYDKARYEKNKEAIKSRVKLYQEQNQDRLAASRAIYYLRNAERIKLRSRAWASNNPERRSLSKAAGRERDRISEGAHDYQQLRELLKKQRGCCAVCKVPLNGKQHKDHIRPLVLGGSNYIENIQFLCPTCNMQKNKKDPIAFMQQRGFLL